MENLKTTLFYLVGVAGLVVITVLLTGQIEADIRPLATATPPATATPAQKADCNPTPGGLALGYLPGAPLTTTLAPPGTPGKQLIISGKVYASDCVTPLSNALVQVWHADAEGRYDRSEPYTLRGQMRTNAQGEYQFTTIKPGSYDTRTGVRPAHIHFWVSFGESDPLATRLLFAGDPQLEAATDVTPELVTQLVPESRPAEPVWRGQFDIVLPVAPPAPPATGADDL